MIGWFGIGHEARNTPPRRCTQLRPVPPTVANLNRPKKKPGAGARQASEPPRTEVVPRFEAVGGQGGHLSRSPHRPLITAVVERGQLRGIRWHFRGISCRRNWRSRAPTTEPKTEVIGGWGCSTEVRRLE